MHPLDVRQTAIFLPKQPRVIRLHHQPHIFILIEVENAIDDLGGAPLAPIRKNRNLHHARVHAERISENTLLCHDDVDPFDDCCRQFINRRGKCQTIR